MPLIATRPPGRQLMVLDDAETIARQARRRVAMQRRRRERLQQAGAISVVLAIAAVLLGASPSTVLLTALAVSSLLAMGLHRVLDRQQASRRRRVITQPGRGIGAPRPKGGFSTTRHRSGAPVWTTGNHAA